MLKELLYNDIAEMFREKERVVMTRRILCDVCDEVHARLGLEQEAIISRRGSKNCAITTPEVLLHPSTDMPDKQ
jgi:hypothetical protein